jgi:tRNA G18 (ribose-2'-O)-methylase SpoU
MLMIDDTPSRPRRALTKDDLRQAKPPRAAFEHLPRRPIRVVLDGVRQGYNVGALFRLCDAFLCEELVICGRDGSHGTRKLMQAAQGTSRWVPWRASEDTVPVVQQARLDGYRVIVVEQTDDAVDIDAFQPSLPLCLVLGSEKSGVSDDVLRLADGAVAIPMSGMANSLNVPTAAAIVLHTLTRSLPDSTGQRVTA